MASPFTRRTYRRLRWSVAVSAVMGLGLLAGFAAGLARPRAQTPRIGEA
jgi:hypothetical protein